MFVTEDNGAVGDPFAFLNQGEHSWWYVKRRLHTYWFKVIYRNTLVEKGMLAEILFLDDVEQLEEISGVEAIILDKVYIITPSHINGSDDWMMEPIENIFRVQNSEWDASGYLFTLKNKVAYKSSAEFFEDESKLSKTLVFSMNKSQ